MNEQEQRIALCEWMGWKRHPIAKNGPDCWHSPDGRPQSWEDGMLPDTNSLDVLHEMEMKLNDDEYDRFANHLDEIMAKALPMAPVRTLLGASIVMPSTMLRHYSVPAAQRREALLKALGLWKD